MTAVQTVFCLLLAAAPTTLGLPLSAGSFEADVLNRPQRACRLYKRPFSIAGWDIHGNPVADAVCIGDCPANHQNNGNCQHGCAPSDYTTCYSSCFTGGESACNAQQDATGDAVCGWDAAAAQCRGCHDFTTAYDCGSKPNCDWNGAQCMAKGPTTSPKCDGRGSPCPGHSEDECGEEDSSDNDGDDDRECKATGWLYLYKFRGGGDKVTTRAPDVTTDTVTLVTRPVDFPEIADWEKPLPGHRNARAVDYCRTAATTIAQQQSLDGVDLGDDSRCAEALVRFGLIVLVRVPTGCDCQ